MIWCQHIGRFLRGRTHIDPFQSKNLCKEEVEPKQGRGEKGKTKSSFGVFLGFCSVIYSRVGQFQLYLFFSSCLPNVYFFREQLQPDRAEADLQLNLLGVTHLSLLSTFCLVNQVSRADTPPAPLSASIYSPPPPLWFFTSQGQLPIERAFCSVFDCVKPLPPTFLAKEDTHTH